MPVAASTSAGRSGSGEERREKAYAAAVVGSDSGGSAPAARTLWKVRVAAQKPLRGSIPPGGAASSAIGMLARVEVGWDYLVRVFGDFSFGVGSGGRLDWTEERRRSRGDRERRG